MVEAAVPKVASVADDVVEAAVPKAVASVDDVLEAAATPKNDIVRQLTDGVDKVNPINPNIAENYAVEGATNKALADNNTLASKLNTIGEAVEDSGSKLRNNQIIGAVKDKKVLQRAPDAIKFADKYGFTDGQYEDLANIMTGNEGILSNFNNNALKNAQVSALVPDEARTKALKAIENSIALEPHQKKTLTNIINTANDVPQGKIAERLAERGENRAAAIGEADIYDLHKAVQELEGKAYDMTGKGADAARKIVRDYAGDLKKSINAASKDVYNNPDNIQELSEALVGANLSPRLTQDIVKQLRDGVDYTTLRSMQSPFVTLGQIAKQQKMAPLAGGVGGQSFNNPLAQVAEEVVGKPLAAATGKALQTGGRALQLASKNSDNIANGAKNAALAGAGLIALGQMNGGQQQGADQLSGNSGQLGGAQGAQAQQKELQQAQQLQAMQQLMQPSKFAGKDRDQIEQAYMAAAADNNPKAVQFYASMLEQLDKKDAMNQKQLAALQKASSSKTSKDDQKKADAAKKAASIETMYKQAGGAQGPVGVLNNLLNSATLGMFNPGASAYEANQQALAVALARAAGDSGALSNQDIQGYKSMLPLTTDSPQAAKLKLQNIYAQLGQ